MWFLEKRIREGFWGKIEQSFRPEQFAPERTIKPIWLRKEVWGWFRQQIPTANVFFGMDETSLRDSFSPNRAI